MEAIDAQSFQPVLDALPAAAILALGAMVVVGVILWLLGRSLARMACVISGLVLGGLAGLMVGQAFAEQGAFALPLVLGGGIAGALLAGLLFRVWMGISGAVLLALLAPAASIVWTGTPPPIHLGTGQEQVEDGEADEAAAREQRREEARRAEVRRDETRRAAAGREDGEEAEEEASEADGPIDAVMTTLRGIYEAQAEGVRTWWDELGDTARGVLMVAALLGGVVGLLLGLIAPNIAASAESALVGSILMFYPGRELLARLAPDQMGWLPHTPRATLLTLGLITLLGVLIQWTVLRRRTDK